MAYQAPSISATGLSIPQYTDIINLFITNFQNIYGQQAYLANDSPDFQLLSIIALAASDCEQALQLVFNNEGPSFAIGPALDLLVKLNGLTRKPASFSTCTVTLTGTAGTVINNGVISDVNLNLWNLPASVTIGGGGTVSVTATAQAAGPITVAANQITGIVTPVAGWVSVTNGTNLPATGQNVEADSQLRARQAISTELPSISMVTGTYADLLAIPGVTSVYIDENTTSSTNANGTPGHSIQCVVKGGVAQTIANAIYENKSIGCGTYGNTSETVIDPVTGVSNTIEFTIPSGVTVYVILGVHKLATYTSALTALIENAVLAYINSLAVGENVSYAAIVTAAMNVNLTLESPAFLIEVASTFIGTTPSPSGTTDITIAFNQVAQTVLTNITVNFV